MIKINGQSFHGAEVSDLKRGERRDYKYDLVAESGRRRSELRARYRTYSITLGSLSQADYDALRAALATSAESVSITVPDGQDDVTLDARVELGNDALVFLEPDGTRRWDGLALNVTGVLPLEDGR
ncbi:hypothetical protein [Anaeromassilibacillus senegalensis]|uniref:hypothetical protein n=1 Tax=Anaeromassilibacillus senegalensis TaxID=1673717 RepID=UPI0006833750|nr:hypothetical protein [Anaeromassilibacillus senegalensis]